MIRTYCQGCEELVEEITDHGNRIPVEIWEIWCSACKEAREEIKEWSNKEMGKERTRIGDEATEKFKVHAGARRAGWDRIELGRK